MKIILQIPSVDPNAGMFYWGGTPLIRAVEWGALEAVKLLLKDVRVDVNAVDRNGRTALHAACSSRRPRIVEALLADSRTDVNCHQCTGTTPLMSAAQVGSQEAVELLLQDVRVDVNEVDRRGKTALHRACKEDQDRIVAILLANPWTNVHCRQPDGTTPLMLAVHNRSLKAAKAFMQDLRVDLNAVDHDGRTALHQACIRGYHDIVRALLADPRTDVNYQRDADSWSPLMFAAFEGNLDTVAVILDCPRVTVNSKGKTVTAIELAWAKDHVYVVMFMLTHPGVELSIPDVEESDPPPEVVYGDHTNLVDVLLADQRVDMGTRNNCAQTAFILAVTRRRLELVKLLRQHGLDLKTRINKGPAPLMHEPLQNRIAKYRTIIDSLYSHFPKSFPYLLDAF